MRHLADKGVSFDRKHPMVDEKAEAELAALGIYATPVTIIDGEVVLGFDAEKLDRLLER